MLIYLAGLLFSEAERCFNAQLTEKLEALDFRVFLPQRDGVQREKLPYDAMAPEERRHATFDLDLAKILEADVFLFVLDGRVPDEGACVELDIAYCQKELERGQTASRSPDRHPRRLSRVETQPYGARRATVRGGG